MVPKIHLKFPNPLRPTLYFVEQRRRTFIRPVPCRQVMQNRFSWSVDRLDSRPAIASSSIPLLTSSTEKLPRVYEYYWAHFAAEIHLSE
jgi:hypothetical protein